ncbi:MAG: DNA internalization-related competence protein ComEC/Rec2, partial [Syntrophobacteria bacterium]
LYPEALFSASFQLSFIAVGALVFVVPRLPFPRAGDGHQRGWPRRLRLLCQFIAVSLVLSLFTAPAVLYHFHRVSPVGTVANIVVVPLVSFLILPAGLAALCILPVSTNLAGFLLTLGSLGLDLVVKVATWLGGLSWACLWPGIPRAWEVALAYVLLLLPFLRVSSWWRGGLILAGSLLLVVSWTLPAGFGSKQSFLRVTYLDVGQGNSAVVEFPQKAVMLIDGGGFQGSSFDVGRHLVAPYLWHRRIRSLDVMALSHAHADHFLGLRFVAAHFPVKEFWYNKVSTDDPHFLELIDCLARKNVAFLGPEHLASGRRIQGVDVKVLHPPAGSGPVAAVPTHTELNNLSLVLWLRYKHIGFLFPGDIEREAERRLTSLPGLKPVQVLLVPHHGSRTSSSMAFLQRLKPKIAVFSLGFANPFHLPASRVRKRYRNLGVRTCRTDRHGAITIRTDGHDIQVETFLPAKQ